MQKSAIAFGEAVAMNDCAASATVRPASRAITKIKRVMERDHQRISRSITGKTLLLAMKLTVFFFTVFMLNVQASGYSQSVTLSVKNAPLREVFSEIRKQTGFIVFYNRELLSDVTPVSFSAYNVPLKDFMAICLKEQPLDFIIKDKTIILMQRATVPVQDSVIGLSGRVHDEQGKPIAGITVRAVTKSTIHIAVTNENGDFFINGVSPGTLIQVTGVNIDPWERKLAKGESWMDIEVRNRVYLLEDVKVVLNTGYQVLDKERATGAFSKPDMKVISRRTGTMDIASRLEGQVAGLSVNFSTEAGSPVTRRQSVIRGISSVSNSNSEPLYVVNGVILPDFNTLNPDDIEDITVLKDAAASAIYGARSANGVIVIVTKSGLRNQRLQVNYNGFVNYQDKPYFDYKPMLNSRQYIDLNRQLFNPELYPWSTLYNQFIAPHDLIMYNEYRGLITAAQANKSLDSLAGIDNMGQIKDLFYLNPYTTNHTVSLSGGNNFYTFYGSMNYTGTRGGAPGSRSSNYRLNLTQDMRVGSRVKLSLSTSLLNATTQGKGSLMADNSFLPYQLFKDADGNNIHMPYMMGWSDSLRLDYQARSRISMDYDPIKELDYERSTSSQINANVTANVSVDLWKGLRFTGTYGYQRAPTTSSSYFDNRHRYQREMLLSFTVAPTVNDEPVYYLPVKGGSYRAENSNQRNWTVRNQLAWESPLRHGLDMISVQAGQEALEQMTSSNRQSIYGYDPNTGSGALIDYLTLSRGIPNTITGWGSLYMDDWASRDISRFSSYFGLASYTLNGKYNVDVSWRQDRSSLFGSDVSSQNKPIWSLGGKWQVYKEPFMAPVNWVDNLSVRLTYGITGNSPYIGAAASNDIIYAAPQSSTQGIAGDALSLTTPANRMLNWELTKNLNLGIDFAMLDSRISGALDLYMKRTVDLLGNVRLNVLSGYNSALGNIGQLNNSGVELSLQTLNVKGKDFSWNTRLVFSYNHNKLVSFTPLASWALNDPTYKLTTNYMVGYSMSTLFAYDFVGLDNMGDPQIRLADGTITKAPYVATADDLVYTGTRQPKINGGFSNTFRYRDISLALNMIYNFGNVMRGETLQYPYGRLAGFNGFYGLNISPLFLERWQKPGDEAFTNMPSYVADPNEDYSRRNLSYYRWGDQNVLNASYIKLRDVTLSYDLPQKTLRWLNIPQAGVFVQATNFMIWRANDQKIDPEFIDIMNGIRTLPPFRHSYALGLNINL